MFPHRGVQLVVYHGVLLVSAGREGEGGPDLDLGGDITGDIEQHRVTPGAGPHEDGNLVTLRLAGGSRFGACGLLKRINKYLIFSMPLLIYFTCWWFPAFV